MQKRMAKVAVLSPVKPGITEVHDDDKFFLMNDSEDHLYCHICSALIKDDIYHAYDLGPNQAVCERCAGAYDEEE